MLPRASARHGSSRSTVLNCLNVVKGVMALMFFGMIYFNYTYNLSATTGMPVAEVIDEVRPIVRKHWTGTPLVSAPIAADDQIIGEPDPTILNPERYTLRSGCDFSEFIRLFEPEKLMIHCGNIHEVRKGRKLGQGYWRKVYEGDFRGTRVAMKLVRQQHEKRRDIVTRHVQEAAMLFQLRNEPNVVHLLGWCNSTIIVDYVSDQLEALVFDRENDLPVERALELALDAAKGVAQLHQITAGPIAHTDIQTRQFLINSQGVLLLNDFNRQKYAGPAVSGSDRGKKCFFMTPVAKGKWRAPEEYTNEKLTEKLDVYSLSMVLWTLRSREPPFEDIERVVIYKDVPEKGIRPNLELMKDYPEAMQELIQEGWAQDLSKRPTAAEMVTRIEKILTDYKSQNK